MIPEESALQEEKVLPTYNLPDTETLSKGDVNIKKVQMIELLFNFSYLL
ncbi:MAG: hypothetical protein CM15mV51_0650 [uncultured marine virus]|nr:MAG: hypothetical protein CM15mV51_0650 [uncultured marine virus]